LGVRLVFGLLLGLGWLLGAGGNGGALWFRWFSSFGFLLDVILG
jgi:hypothetical protein